MSAIAPPPPPPPFAEPSGYEAQPAPPPLEPRLAPERRGPAAESSRFELPVRLLAFAALAWFCAAQYAALVIGTEGARVVALVAVATAAGVALVLSARVPGPRAGRVAVRLAVAVLSLAAGLAATGLKAKLLLPGHWDELGDGLSRGFDGLDSFKWPYDGRDGWVRLTLRLALPALILPAALLAFWPLRRMVTAARLSALGLLLILYGTGVTERGAGTWALRGAVLLLLVAAWLWLPRLSRREAGRAALAVAACGLLALPLAASFDADQPWIDYRHWDWFDPPKTGAAFDWNHSYGPLRWSRTGETLLNVKSREPHYWKAETLTRFDGLRWLHSESPYGRGDAAQDIPDQRNPRWDEHIAFTVRNLRSRVVIGAGTTYSVDGSKITSRQPDGTVALLDEPLEPGDNYTVDAYVPDPTADQMRAAPPDYPTYLLQYTAFDLPRRGESGLERFDPQESTRVAFDARPPIVRDFPGSPLSGLDRERVLASPYAQTYRLARRLARGQKTTYDTVKAVENHLQRNYKYSETPPRRRYPLPAFLFQDRIGYCQQFSGAMALMLRMNGIPARVAAGFSPGFYDRTAKEYRVRDLDAHSWVEVWFADIGWVPFDPTPSLSPASSQSNPRSAASAARGTSADRGSTTLRGDRLIKDTPTGGSAGGGGQSQGRPWLLGVAIGAALAVALAGLWLSGTLRRRRRLHAEGAIEELRAALPRLGYSLPARTTLAELERRLGRTAGPGAAHYVALLREQRYAPPGMARTPTAHDRGELRRALTAGRGLTARLRGLVALPPHPRRAPTQ